MRALVLILAAALAAACTTMPPAPVHRPTIANVQVMRSTDVPAMALGNFALAEGLPERMDRTVQIRAELLRAPDGSFSQYLRQTLEAELTAAGKLDAASGTTISAFLTQSHVETGGETSTAVVAARFIVTRAGQTLYDREHTVTDEWPTQFIGAIAIPEAMNRYTGLYPALVHEVFSSPDFRAAIRGG